MSALSIDFCDKSLSAWNTLQTTLQGDWAPPPSAIRAGHDAFIDSLTRKSEEVFKNSTCIQGIELTGSTRVIGCEENAMNFQNLVNDFDLKMRMKEYFERLKAKTADAEKEYSDLLSMAKDQVFPGNRKL